MRYEWSAKRIILKMIYKNNKSIRLKEVESTEGLTKKSYTSCLVRVRFDNNKFYEAEYYCRCNLGNHFLVIELRILRLLLFCSDRSSYL